VGSAPSHHHTLGVEAEHQRIAVGRRFGDVRGIEAVHVGRRPSRQFLDLPPTQPHPGGSSDGRRRVGERPPGGLQSGELAQPVRVFLDRQVQRRVRRVQVDPSSGPVGDPRHAHLTEPGGQPSPVSTLGPATPVSLDVDHIGQALLPHRPKIETVLQQLPQQRQPIGVQPFFQLSMGHPGRLATGQPRHQPVKPRVRRGERGLGAVGCVRLHPAPSSSVFGCRNRRT